MRTSAFATTAPLGSCTVPVIAPVAPPCPKAAKVTASAITLSTVNLIALLAMVFLPTVRLNAELVLLRKREREASTRVGSSPLIEDTPRFSPVVYPEKVWFTLRHNPKIGYSTAGSP